MITGKIQIIIPMSGFGERFRHAGYKIPKPLIEINNKPIIAHVIEMFPGETDFIFICNENHLKDINYQMENILKKYCPTGRIISIPSHKLGPIYAVLQAQDKINKLVPTIVNYCDFTCYWDWHHFKVWLKNSNCSGAVPGYRYFHPHTLGTTNYAYIREKNHWMLDIQEKKPFTDNRMNEYASSGTYYFSSGKLMLDAFNETMQANRHVNGEYYVSLAYHFLLSKNLPIGIYDLQHFMQWGTPEDVMEYNRWSNIFERLSQKKADAKFCGTVIIPMAGLGQRFVNEGYELPKPLIDVSGKPMILQSTDSLPKGDRYCFILRNDMPGFKQTSELLLENYSNSIVELIPKVTEGQACSALIGLEAVTKKWDENFLGPILFGACDNGITYDEEKFNDLLKDDMTDVIVFGTTGHPHAIRCPEMYGWVKHLQNNIQEISVKKPLSSPQTDPIVIGSFLFKNAKNFKDCIKRMIQRDCRINGEFYLDTCINDAIALKLKCKLFLVEHYISWGTPNDLRTFEYWQSCFHKWNVHTYHLQMDYSIPKNSLDLIEKNYQRTIPNLLEPII